MGFNSGFKGLISDLNNGYLTSKHMYICDIFFGATAPQWARAPPSFTRFLDHTQRRTEVGRTCLDEWSARRRDLYLTKHNTHNRQISMQPVGFEPTVSAGERPQTYALDGAATGTSTFMIIPRWIPLRITNISGGTFTEIQNRFYEQKSPPPRKSCRIWDDVEECGIVRQVADNNMAHAHYKLGT